MILTECAISQSTQPNQWGDYEADVTTRHGPAMLIMRHEEGSKGHGSPVMCMLKQLIANHSTGIPTTATCFLCGHSVEVR